MLTLLLLLIFLVVAAACWFQGLWGALITLVNLLLAAMIATNYFEPIASQLARSSPAYDAYWDFLMLWGLFALAFGLLRAVTDFLTRQNVGFNIWVDYIGRSIVALWIAWVFISFTCMTLHTMPLGTSAFGGRFMARPSSATFLGLTPDRVWLGFIQSRSRGALARSSQKPASNPADEGKNPADEGKRVFDPKSEFMLKYYQRRANWTP